MAFKSQNHEELIKLIQVSRETIDSLNIYETLLLESNRKFHYWQFLDNIGKKKCSQALNIYKSLISNGISHNYIVFGLTNLFMNIYAKKLYLNVDNDFPILNKILQRNIKTYSSTYKLSETTNILNHLYKIDKMVKTFQYGINYEFEMLILKACYEKQ